MKKKNLLRMIRDLEIQTEFRKTVVLSLVEAVKPTETFRYRYLLYAINNDFVAADVEGIEEFLRWAFRREDSQWAREMHGPLTRDEMLEKFDEHVPSRKGKLEEILLEDRADGEMGVWGKWANIVLGPDPNRQSDDDNVNEPESKS